MDERNQIVTKQVFRTLLFPATNVPRVRNVTDKDYPIRSVGGILKIEGIDDSMNTSSKGNIEIIVDKRHMDKVVTFVSNDVAIINNKVC